MNLSTSHRVVSPGALFCRRCYVNRVLVLSSMQDTTSEEAVSGSSVDTVSLVQHVFDIPC